MGAPANQEAVTELPRLCELYCQFITTFAQIALLITNLLKTRGRGVQNQNPTHPWIGPLTAKLLLKS